MRRLMFPDDGWRFSLDDFPATASNAGPIKTVLEWALPKAVLGDSTFQEIASSDGRHYQQTLFPFRLEELLRLDRVKNWVRCFLELRSLQTRTAPS